MENTDNSLANNSEGELDQNKALQVLINAIHIGQSRGAWKLEETVLLNKAIQTFVKKDA